MTPRRRPRVAINTAISADGKVNTARRARFHFSGPHDKALMRRLRADADAVIWGAGTALTDDPVVRVVRPELVEARRARGAPPHPLNVLITSSGRVPPDARFFMAGDVPKVVFTTLDAAIRAEYRDRAEVVAFGYRVVDLAAALEWLANRGVQFALVEGGPRINHALLGAGLVDELFVTICPLVIGGAASPTLADGPGFAPAAGPSLRLTRAEQKDDEVFLRYAVEAE